MLQIATNKFSNTRNTSNQNTYIRLNETVKTDINLLPNSVDLFEKICRNSGIIFPKAHISFSKNKCRGLYAQSIIHKNETFLKIPLHCMFEIESRISHFRSKESNSGKPFIENIILNALNTNLKEAYIQNLPENFDHSLFHFSDELKNNTHFGQRIALNLQWLKSVYSKNINQNETSLNELIWTTMIVCSRQFSFNQSQYLVPIADMINHSDTRFNCRFYFNQHKKELHFVALKKIKPGQELIHVYEENLNTASCLLGYAMMPSKMILKKRPLIHYIFNKRIYYFSNNIASNLIQIIQNFSNKSDSKSTHALLPQIAQHLSLEILKRVQLKNKILMSTPTRWQFQVTELIIEQEIENFTKLKRLIEIFLSNNSKLCPSDSYYIPYIKELKHFFNRPKGSIKFYKK